MGRYDSLLETNQKPTRPAQVPSLPRQGEEISPQPAENDAAPANPVSEPVPTPAVMDDVTTDVLTSPRQDENLRGWREIIENTETRNSALRISVAEREAVEDLVRELRRTHRIKTSMNELARLGLLYLIQDFQRSGERSLIPRVKRS